MIGFELKKLMSSVSNRLLLGTAAGVLVLSGCTASHYQRAADKEVYRIVQHYEAQIFGHTNAFSIDTPYSDRKPAEIPPSELIEDRLATNQRVLTVEGALALAATSSRRYQTAKERLYLTALSLTGARYEFSPQFLATSTAGLSRTTDGEWSDNVNSRLSVSQLFKSGGKLTVTLVNDLLRYYTGDPRENVANTITVNLIQPLLRGFGQNNPDVESLTQAERDTVYAVRDFSYFQDQYALETVNDYFRLLQQKEGIRNGYTNYLRRVDSSRRLEALSKDRAARSEVDQARQTELTAKNAYINAVANYWNSLDTFKIKLGLTLNESVSLDDKELDRVMQAGLVPVIFNPDEAYHLAVQRHPPILNAIDQFEDSKRKVRVAADQLRPNLTLTATARLDSDDYPDYTNFDPNKTRVDAGLAFDLPINRVPARNNYRATVVSFEAELRSLTLTLDTLKDSIERGLRTVDQRRQNYLIQQGAVELANSRVDSTTLLLQAGRVVVRDVIDALDAQIAAQVNVTAALVDYQQSRLQLMLDIGALQSDVPQFWLKNQLSSYLPGGVPPITEAELAEKPVIPPDQLFNN